MSWHWVAVNPTGTVMVAAPIPGRIHRSVDSGATWTVSNSPERLWISVDMTPDGTRMAAVGFSGGMYLSTNGGLDWTRIDTTVNPGESLEYESVTISEDGQRIVAVDLGGNVYTSVNGAEAAAANVAGARFRAIDGSADGTFLVAASETGSLFQSADGGVTFTPLAITVDGTAITDSWYRVAVSPDGNTIAAAGNTDFPGAKVSTGVYVSRDRGATWVRGLAESSAYTSLDTSQNGDIIVATRSGNGDVLLSTNGGTSFAPITEPEGEANWRAAAITSDASRLLLAAGTFFSQTGRVYLSSGSVTGE
ncbi:WD40/YVTN/BNR-like repeat-containing protein [Ramlibacter tataouinensis]|uniref:Photosynthesis system II assembly factor Ycf48/Hcf136-like domain-containing protein n=1 Tax=Ramlibacter tataouinensis (strain ATCC BAA-407 / DSM 14655 / LMG 21543 / TTB310) TaxID=365046 RepID=F5Y6A7_RAMTT|nr:sialidase family protein [Ramlibacter tataouinensis]AEG92793.1 hypothetical protein Rta_17030 [Ramlibacter tataouinensis TTB310]